MINIDTISGDPQGGTYRDCACGRVQIPPSTARCYRCEEDASDAHRRDLRERLVCAALTGHVTADPQADPDTLAERAVMDADATLDAMEAKPERPRYRLCNEEGCYEPPDEGGLVCVRHQKERFPGGAR